jgi:hypothetical protein
MGSLCSKNWKIITPNRGDSAENTPDANEREEVCHFFYVIDLL